MEPTQKVSKPDETDSSNLGDQPERQDQSEPETTKTVLGEVTTSH